MLPANWIEEQRRLVELYQKHSDEADRAFRTWDQKCKERDVVKAEFERFMNNPYKRKSA